MEGCGGGRSSYRNPSKTRLLAVGRGGGEGTHLKDLESPGPDYLGWGEGCIRDEA